MGKLSEAENTGFEEHYFNCPLLLSKKSANEARSWTLSSTGAT